MRQVLWIKIFSLENFYGKFSFCQCENEKTSRNIYGKLKNIISFSEYKYLDQLFLRLIFNTSLLLKMLYITLKLKSEFYVIYNILSIKP